MSWRFVARRVAVALATLAAIVGSTFIASGRRRTEPLEWTEE